MSDDEEESAPKEEAPAGAPAWIMTFADLMSLLLCFFVLLLSFSVMDVIRLKTIAGSLKEAFGVQKLVNAEQIPKADSFIKQHFSPGKPTPSPLEIMEQMAEQYDKTSEISQQDSENDPKSETDITDIEQELKQQAKDIAEVLNEEIKDGKIEIEVNSKRIIIRILEESSFASGSAELELSFLPILNKIGDVIKDLGKQIIIEGHTDNIPIENELFRSNWDLSASRSASVAIELIKIQAISATNIIITGYADTKPLYPNETAENRAKNRRVEIVIIKGDNLEAEKAINIDNPDKLLEINK